MTSFKLIFRNVHKNIRDYLIYFLTLTLSVSLFYAFNSISDQPAFSDMGITGSLLYDQLGILLSALSVVIAVVLAFLIIYANQFLLKRRKKELGVYMVLGMKKRRISRLFAGETLCVGVIALVSGFTPIARITASVSMEVPLLRKTSMVSPLSLNFSTPTFNNSSRPFCFAFS
jgi:putative ABC transport system permease protein